MYSGFHAKRRTNFLYIIVRCEPVIMWAWNLPRDTCFWNWKRAGSSQSSCSGQNIMLMHNCWSKWSWSFGCSYSPSWIFCPERQCCDPAGSCASVSCCSHLGLHKGLWLLFCMHVPCKGKCFFVRMASSLTRRVCMYIICIILFMSTQCFPTNTLVCLLNSHDKSRVWLSGEDNYFQKCVIKSLPLLLSFFLFLLHM